MKEILEKIGNYITTYGLRLALVVCVVVIGVLLMILLSFLLKKILYKTRIDDSAVSFVVAIFRIVIIILIVGTCAGILELSTSSLVVSLSTVALAIALSLKESLSNLASGLVIIGNKPFKRGDWVKVNDIEGKVQSIKLLTTEIITFDNAKIVLPNNTVANGSITNYSSFPIRRLDLNFGVAYGSDMNVVEKAFKDVFEADDRIIKTIAPVIFMASHDSSQITYSIKIWVSTLDYFNVKWSLPRTMYDKFNELGITIPFNQLDVHIIK